ncbi:MerR family transcriptional regulator [Paenibacillus sp. FJAT-26967]|uniref:MerR family transcriptional regulator n=1 Tax=Paenibacillus sp. FJAT-26967 TaxID=1729690 RepID=UPI0008391AA4|nr:MerR family transcriptional regulator [Paenibacillus sp. FJAT-26967]
MYLVGELSAKTGVTIRTLHYYDRVGLLQPARQSDTGYRIYDSTDILKLQEIFVLKEMGFSLSAIKNILDQNNRNSKSETREDVWKEAIISQISSLRDEQRRLFRIEQLLQGSLYSIEVNDEVRLEEMLHFIKEIQTIEPENKNKWRTQFFTPEEIAKLPSDDLNDPLIQEWTRLLKKIRELVHEPENSARSQELAKEILSLSDQLFQGDEALTEKYWESMRPAAGEQPRLYGMDVEMMAYVDKIVDYYLQFTEEGDIG